MTTLNRKPVQTPELNTDHKRLTADQSRSVGMTIRDAEHHIDRLVAGKRVTIKSIVNAGEPDPNPVRICVANYLSRAIDNAIPDDLRWSLSPSGRPSLRSVAQAMTLDQRRDWLVRARDILEHWRWTRIEDAETWDAERDPTFLL